MCFESLLEVAPQRGRLPKHRPGERVRVHASGPLIQHRCSNARAAQEFRPSLSLDHYYRLPTPGDCPRRARCSNTRRGLLLQAGCYPCDDPDSRIRGRQGLNEREPGKEIPGERRRRASRSSRPAQPVQCFGSRGPAVQPQRMCQASKSRLRS